MFSHANSTASYVILATYLRANIKIVCLLQVDIATISLDILM